MGNIYNPPTNAAQAVEVVVKSADTSIQSDTTLTADADLKFSIAANAKAAFDLYIDQSVAGNSFTCGWSYPVGCTMTWQLSQAAINAGVLTQTSTQVITNAAGTRSFTHIYGIVRNGATAGVINFMWCQTNSTANNTTLFAGSNIAVRNL